MSEIQSLTERALADVAAAQTPDQLEALRVALLGKSGSITAQLKQLGTLPADQRKAAGEAINLLRDALTAALAERKNTLETAALDARLAGERIDVTLPGRRSERGGLHPVTRTLERIVEIFARLGYELSDGPEIEDDWHNFEALNFPPHHPARAMHDTFYFGDGRLLRTHTSGVQVRYMDAHKPPLHMIAAGKVYRSDSDQTHSPMFHQLEGLLVDEHSTFADLKGTLSEFVRAFSSATSKCVSAPAISRSWSRVRKWISPGSSPTAARAGWKCWAAAWCTERAAQRRYRPRALHRLRLRPGRGALCDAALRRQRSARVLRERCAFSSAVCLTAGIRDWGFATVPRSARTPSTRSS